MLGLLRTKTRQKITNAIVAAILLAVQLPLTAIFTSTAKALAPPSISVSNHEGQKSDSTWSNGDITTYSEGDSINFRFTLDGDASTSGDMIVAYTNEDAATGGGTCNFFESTFSNLSTTAVSGTAPTVTTSGSPVDTSTGPNSSDWQQTLHVVFSAVGEATVNYTLTLTANAADCTGSSQGSHFENAASAGDFKNISTQKVPVPANKLTVTPTTGTLTVYKTTKPDGSDPTLFPITISSSTGGTWTGAANQTVSTSQSVTYTVTPGTYSIAEDLSALPGWSTVYNGCSDKVVTAGHDTPCTIDNSYEAPVGNASLKIIKDAQPNGPTQFNFSTTGSGLNDFTLDDDNGTPTPKFVTFSSLSADTYTVTEAATAGWDLSNIKCTGINKNQVSYDLASGKLTITLADSDNAKCTFTNQQRRASILGHKYEDMNGDGIYDSTTDTGVAGWTIDLFSGSTNDPANLVTTTPTLNDGSYGFTNLKKGTYTVCEEQQSSWTQTFPSDTTYSTVKGCYTLTLTYGRKNRVKDGIDFLNFHNNTVTVHKFNDANANGTQEKTEANLAGWLFKLYGDKAGQPDTSNLLDTSAATDSSGNTTFSKTLTVGTYWICEVSQAQWVQTYPLNGSCAKVEVTTSGQNLTFNFGNFNMLTGGRGGDLVSTKTTTTPSVAELANTGSSALLGIFVGLAVLGMVAAVAQRPIKPKYE